MGGLHCVHGELLSDDGSGKEEETVGACCWGDSDSRLRAVVWSLLASGLQEEREKRRSREGGPAYATQCAYSIHVGKTHLPEERCRYPRSVSQS